MMKGVAKKNPERLEPVLNRRPEANRGGLREIPRRYRNFSDPKSEVHRLGQDLRVEDESIGISHKRNTLQELSTVGPISRMILRKPLSKN
jgi:hypothetical protein